MTGEGPDFTQFYEFGPFRLDPHKHRLTRDGEVLSLAPKALEALLVMVRNPGKVMEREALIQAVWAGACVEDANLSVAISQLRKALGQNGETAEYVHTVARVGYRFVPDVREVREEPAPLVIEQPTSSRAAIEEERSLEPAVRRTWALAVAGIALVAVIGAGIWTARGTNHTGPFTSRPRSIAVLPLKSFAQASDDEELRLRITDALITTLGKVTDMSVRPTHSILIFTRAETDAREAGRKLKVDAVLDGRLQAEGERLRVTLQLVSVPTGETLWSGQFDGTTNGTLDLQDRISAQLLPRLVEGTPVVRSPTANTEAYENYLRGRYLWNKRTPSGSNEAIDHFERAVALDPAFALAYAGLADAYSMLANGGALPAYEGYAKAKQMAERALAIDPTLSEAYSALGWILSRHDFNWAAAEQAFARAIALNRNNPEAHHWRGQNANALGRTDEYLASMETARRLAPFTMPIARNYYDVVLTKSGCTKAFEYLESFHTLYDTSEGERAELSGYHHARCGNYDRAVAVMERTQTDKLGTKAKSILAVAYARTGRRQQALDILEGLNRTDSRASLYLRSYIHVALGDFESAFACLDKAIAAHDDRCVRLKQDQFLAPLHSDARFSQLLRRMNLPG